MVLTPPWSTQLCVEPGLEERDSLAGICNLVTNMTTMYQNQNELNLVLFSAPGPGCGCLGDHLTQARKSSAVVCGVTKGGGGTLIWTGPYNLQCTLRGVFFQKRHQLCLFGRW